MIKKILLLAFLFLSTSSLVFGQIVFQETVIDTTNTFSIDTVNTTTGEYSIEANYSGDFDGDGDLDLLTKSNPLLWIENTDGLGALTLRHIIDEGVNGVKDLCVNDLDGDGDLDIVIAEDDFAVDVIGWYENLDGHGNFSSKQTISTQVNNPAAIYVIDLDGDTDLDIISSSIGDGKIAWYENTNGQAAFGSQQVITTASISSTTQYIEVVSGDFDNDTDNDILFAAKGSPDQIGYLLENTDGQGTFGSPEVFIDVFGGMYCIKVADIDGDGDDDIYGDNVFDGLLAYKNNGDGDFGNFGSSFNTTYDGFTGFNSAMDVDGDGDLDFIAFVKNEDNTNEGAIIWFENTDGQGAFSDEQIMQTLNFTRNGIRFNISDFDGDGYDDLVCLNVDGYEISWNRNLDGAGAFGGSQEIINDLRGVRDVISADLDGDIDKDIVFVSYENNKIGWYENIDGTGTYGSQQIISPNVQGVDWVSSADINGDGDIDLISASRIDDRVAWYENDGSGSFTQQIISSDSNDARYVTGVDVDGDTDIDIVSLEETGDHIVWYENTDGQGAFGSKQIIIDTLNDIRPFELGDLDGDGDLDVLINEPLSWMSNNGSGNFLAPQNIASTNDGGIRISDLDNDGDLDIITNDPFGWHENEDGFGTFGEYQLIDDQVFPGNNIIILDVDNDGDDDIINTYTASASTSEIKYYKNYGGVFTSGVTIGFTDERLSTLFAEDLSGNGNIDLLYATDKLTNGVGKIAWFRNLGVLNNLISGTVTYDSDSNGCDGSDPTIPNIWVGSGNSGVSFSTFTEDDGTFAIDIGQGDFITLLTPSLPSYFTVTPTFHNSSFVGENEIDAAANFCVTPNAMANDLNISIYPLISPRPGFETSYEVVYNNIGTTTLSGAVQFVYDSTKMQYVTASEMPSSQSGDMINFDFSNLIPFESRSVVLNLNVFASPTTNIDDIINTTVNISPLTGDVTEDDNTYTLQQTVIGSYDPNDISVLEGEQILLEQTDDYLHYIIRFQNTGTVEAVNVRITNIINPRLESFTFQIESLSHEGRVVIEDGIEATFSFDNIMLPSVNDDEAGSNGYITYKIKPKPGAVVGDVFYNDASIFFDFNPAIVTNTVSTEVVDALSVSDFETQSVKMYPNPTSDLVIIKSNSAIETITITDVNGREIKSYANVEIFSVQDLTTGIYFIKIDSGNRIVIKKLIKN